MGPSIKDISKKIEKNLPLLPLSVRTHHKFQKIWSSFCTKKCGYLHPKCPPCPHWTKHPSSWLRTSFMDSPLHFKSFELPTLHHATFNHVTVNHGHLTTWHVIT